MNRDIEKLIQTYIRERESGNISSRTDLAAEENIQLCQAGETWEAVYNAWRAGFIAGMNHQKNKARRKGRA